MCFLLIFQMFLFEPLIYSPYLSIQCECVSISIFGLCLFIYANYMGSRIDRLWPRDFLCMHGLNFFPPFPLSPGVARVRN